jgi:myo-inositol-1(or 4)-monophosphatase
LPGSDREALREPLAAIAREAGAIALTAAKGEVKRWIKDGHSPVSEADIAVNDFLATRLPPLVPDAGWLSEETEDNLARTGAEAVWVVDPIDGTRAFLDRRPDWAVSIALVEHGRPSLAVLFAPVSDELFVASRGRGATRNGATLSAPAGRGLDGARIAGTKRQLDALSRVNPRIAPQPKVHSLALRLARVASGELDSALAGRNGHDWDLAAADLLVHEAGGALTDLAGQILTYNGADTRHGALVAAGPGRHDALIALMRDRSHDFA